MSGLIISCILFTGIHLLISGTRLRGWCVARLGNGGYLAAFSAASAIGLAGMVGFYLAVREPQASALWPMRHLAVLLMWPATVLIVAGLMARGPTSAGGEGALTAAQGPQGIHRVTRHPFLWGMSLWAAIHLVWNPQASSLWFFGGFLVTSLAGTVAIDRKRAADFGEHWARYAGASSNLPLAAAITGRTRLSLREIGWVAPTLATGIWALVAYFHGRLFDLPVL